jgi:hypothetical protein
MVNVMVKRVFVCSLLALTACSGGNFDVAEMAPEPDASDDSAQLDALPLDDAQLDTAATPDSGLLPSDTGKGPDTATGPDTGLPPPSDTGATLDTATAPDTATGPDTGLPPPSDTGATLDTATAPDTATGPDTGLPPPSDTGATLDTATGPDTADAYVGPPRRDKSYVGQHLHEQAHDLHDSGHESLCRHRRKGSGMHIHDLDAHLLAHGRRLGHAHVQVRSVRRHCGLPRRRKRLLASRNDLHSPLLDQHELRVLLIDE